MKKYIEKMRTIRFTLLIIVLTHATHLYGQLNVVHFDPQVLDNFDDISKISFLNENLGLLLGADDSGIVGILTANAGKTWNPIITKSETDFKDFQFVDNSIIASGNSIAEASQRFGKILISQDFGSSWSNYATIDDEILMQWFFTSSIGIIIGYKGIIKTVDSGQSWSMVYKNDDLTQPIQRVFFMDSKTGFAASAASLLKTSDGGDTWSSINTDQKFPLEGFGGDIYFINADTGFIGGSEKILRTSDGGQNWQDVQLNDSSNQSILNFDFVSSTVGFAVSTESATPLGLNSISSTILKTVDGGRTWEDHRFVGSLFSIDFTSEDIGYISGASNLVMKTENGDISMLPDNYPWIVTITHESIEDFLVYPIPVSNELVIETPESISPFSVEIRSINGSLISSQYGTYQHKTTLDLSMFPSGTYFLRLYHNERVLTRKIIVK
jgi:photosystem II stability/assembly factor-like uncharacterized protein